MRPLDTWLPPTIGLLAASIAAGLTTTPRSLGALPLQSKPPSQETLSFKIPASPRIQQFDELTIRFPRARYRATKSARIAIDRFFLIPRH